jgi:hypothetical protein
MALGEKEKDNCKIWFVSCGIVTCCQHHNMIGNVLEGGKPLTDCFGEINDGDLVVGYDVCNGYITGIFEVTKSKQFPRDDDSWLDSMVHYIEKKPPDSFLDFDRYLSESKIAVSKELATFLLQLKETAGTGIKESQKNNLFRAQR